MVSTALESLLEDAHAPMLNGGLELAHMVISWSHLLHGAFPSGQMQGRMGRVPTPRPDAGREAARVSARQVRGPGVRLLRYKFGKEHGDPLIANRAFYLRFV